MEYVQFEEFKKIKMKIGKIVSAEKVEGSDKLIKLKVSFGNEEKICVAGIAEWYKPEELIGKKFVFVVNLVPKKIFGIKSEAMILAALKGDKLSLITIDKEIDEGSEVS